MERSVFAAQGFDGEQGFPIEGGEELDAGIDRLHLDLLAAELRRHHGARAAVALGTTFLGAGTAQILAQQAEHGPGGTLILDRNDFTVQEELNGPLADIGLLRAARHAISSLR